MLSIGQTPYDLKFSLLGIPVRVHPGFWVVGCLLGWREGRLDLVFIWLVCLFASILVHEFGHALSARRFGWPPQVLLYHFGGLASYQPGWGNTRGRAIWIAFAGPLAGFILCALVILVDFGMSWRLPREGLWMPLLVSSRAVSSNLEVAIWHLEWINFAWGLFNLLPVYPLDGGKICSEFLFARSSPRGQVRTHWIGMITAALAALAFLKIGMFIGALMFAGLAYENYRNAQQSGRGYR